MKLKCDHVTNSSSSGFILSLSKDQVDNFSDYMADLNEHEDAGNEGVRVYLIAKDKEYLDEYVNDGPVDWAQKPTGIRFNRMSEDHYKMCLEIVEEGGVAVECWVDHNVSEKFDDDWGSNIMDNYM